MIKTREELRQVLDYEKKMYLVTSKHHLKLWLLRDHDYLVWTYLCALRKMEYHLNAGHKLRAAYWERKRNIIGSRYGLFIWPNSVGRGLRIWHYGDIIVHKDAKIGENCQLHGMNCIGNKGVANSGVPVIGDNVNIGVGAKIVGDVYIADDVSIGANAVVTKSCYEKGAVLVGIPAKNIGQAAEAKEKENHEV